MRIRKEKGMKNRTKDKRKERGREKLNSRTKYEHNLNFK